MKKIISYILITVIIVLQFCGCGANSNESSDVKNTEVSQNSISPDDPDVPVDPESAPDALAVLALGGRDNSLDAYSATVNIPLQVEEPEEAVPGGRAIYFWENSGHITLKSTSIKQWNSAGMSLLFQLRRARKVRNILTEKISCGTWVRFAAQITI